MPTNGQNVMPHEVVFARMALRAVARASSPQSALAIVVFISLVTSGRAHAISTRHALSSSSSAGEGLLRELIVGGGVDNCNKVPALCGPPLGPVPARSAKALRRTWEHGAAELILPPGYAGGSLADVGVAGLSIGRCDLANNGQVYRARPDLETFLASTFASVVKSHKLHGVNTRLSRYDLFHGHMFGTSLDGVDGSDEVLSLLGVLFHCAEYPAANGNVLRMDLGYCQTGSDCKPTLHEWRYRNVLWSTWWSDQVAIPPSQAMWLLDGKDPEIAKLRMDASVFGPDSPNTVWEGYFGQCVADVFHLGDAVWCSNLPDQE